MKKALFAQHYIKVLVVRGWRLICAKCWKLTTKTSPVVENRRNASNHADNIRRSTAIVVRASFLGGCAIFAPKIFW